MDPGDQLERWSVKRIGFVWCNGRSSVELVKAEEVSCYCCSAATETAWSCGASTGYRLRSIRLDNYRDSLELIDVCWAQSSKKIEVRIFRCWRIVSCKG